VKWERNPGVWLARCCAGVLSSSFAVALGDSKTSLANSDVWVYFFLFYSCTTVWKKYCRFKIVGVGTCRAGCIQEMISGTKKLKTTGL